MVRSFGVIGYPDKKAGWVDSWMEGCLVDSLVDGYMDRDLDNVCCVYLCFSKWPIYPRGIPQCHIYTFPISSNALLDALYSRAATRALRW